jgi:hypothetical protein
LEQGALIRLEKTENGAKQNSAVKSKWLLIVFWGPPNNIKTVSFNFVCSQAEIITIFFFPQLSSLFLPLRQVAPPAQKFVDERPLLLLRIIHESMKLFEFIV